MRDEKILILSPFQFRECLMMIGCLSAKDFEEIFGTSSEPGEPPYQFRKFRVEFKGDVARWVGYLDLGNLDLLARYLKKRLELEEPLLPSYLKPGLKDSIQEAKRLKGFVESFSHLPCSCDETNPGGCDSCAAKRALGKKE